MKGHSRADPPPGRGRPPWLGWGVSGSGQAVGSQVFPGYQRSPHPWPCRPPHRGQGELGLGPAHLRFRGPASGTNRAQVHPRAWPPFPALPRPTPAPAFQTRAPDRPAPVISSPCTSGASTGSNLGTHALSSPRASSKPVKAPGLRVPCNTFHPPCACHAAPWFPPPEDAGSPMI